MQYKQKFVKCVSCTWLSCVNVMLIHAFVNIDHGKIQGCGRPSWMGMHNNLVIGSTRKAATAPLMNVNLERSSVQKVAQLKTPVMSQCTHHEGVGETGRRILRFEANALCGIRRVCRWSFWLLIMYAAMHQLVHLMLGQLGRCNLLSRLGLHSHCLQSFCMSIKGRILPSRTKPLASDRSCPLALVILLRHEQ